MARAARSDRPSGARIADWPAILARLDGFLRRLDGATELPAERIDAILRERAEALARPAAPEAGAGGPVRSVLVFNLAGEQYALDAGHASEVLRLESLTPVPRAPERVAGLTNRRGQLLLLVDLHRVLGLRRVGIADLTRVIVVGPPGREVGLLVESVEGISDVPARDVAPSLRGDAFVEGIAGGKLILLDVTMLLGDPRVTDGSPRSP